ncbi:MAG: 50S ribosomal protein L25/general stress protein Ctc [Steroidobacteraceae bacterium]
MKISFELSAEPRNDQGKGASRRLRHAGQVPAVLYGHGEPRNLAFNHQKLLGLIENEKFYSSIISITVGSETKPAIVKDVQMHPARNAIVHLDLQRVVENELIRLHLPIHFKGESISPGVKTQGGVVSRGMTDVEIVCLPKDLPEFVEVDMSGMSLNDTVHLADLKLPAGVTVPVLQHGLNPPVVSIHSPRAAEPEPTAEAAATDAAAAPAAGAAAGDAKKEEAKKEPAKKEAAKK